MRKQRERIGTKMATGILPADTRSTDPHPQEKSRTCTRARHGRQSVPAPAICGYALPAGMPVCPPDLEEGGKLA